MKLAKLSDFNKGWIVGQFEPSLLKADFEVGIHTHNAGEHHQDHFHKINTEINILLDGQMNVNGRLIAPGDIFILEPYEISQVEFITDVRLVVVRNGSDPKDKYVVELK